MAESLHQEDTVPVDSRAELQAVIDSEGVDIGSDEIRAKAERLGALVVGAPTRHEDIRKGTVIDLWSGRPRN